MQGGGGRNPTKNVMQQACGGVEAIACLCALRARRAKRCKMHGGWGAAGAAGEAGGRAHGAVWTVDGTCHTACRMRAACGVGLGWCAPLCCNDAAVGTADCRAWTKWRRVEAMACGWSLAMAVGCGAFVSRGRGRWGVEACTAGPRREGSSTVACCCMAAVVARGCALL